MKLSGKRVVVYELNEVPDRVLDWYVATRPTSTLAKLLEHCTRVKTCAADTGELSPWITWPTVHRGVNNQTHCISDFGQDLSDVNREYPPIWCLLAEAGIKTGLFGSLHSYPVPEPTQNYAFYMPDTFAAGPETLPDYLSAFQRFNLAMVDTSARNVGRSIVAKPALDLLTRARALGVRPSTVARLANQLISERVSRLRRVRRRTSQIQLAFDLYIKQLEQTQPAFTTFFTNHVASSMHRYWPATFPQDYVNKKLSAQWLESFSDEIAFTMREADRQVERLLQFVKSRSGYVLVVMTSMGQAAVDDSEIVRKQLYVNDSERFLGRLGVLRQEWSSRRAMLPRYIFQVGESAAATLRANLRILSVNGTPVSFEEHEANVFSLRMGHVNLDDETIDVRLGGKRLSLEEMGLVNTVIEDETGSYAYHIPDGLFLLYDPQLESKKVMETTIGTTEIAPALLRNFGVPVPAYMSS